MFDCTFHKGSESLVSDIEGGWVLGDDGLLYKSVRGDRKKRQLSETICILKDELIVNRRTTLGRRVQLPKGGAEDTVLNIFCQYMDYVFLPF